MNKEGMLSLLALPFTIKVALLRSLYRHMLKDTWIVGFKDLASDVLLITPSTG